MALLVGLRLSSRRGDVSSVDIAAVCYPEHDCCSGRIVDLVDDPVLPDPDPPVAAAARQLLDAIRTWFVGQRDHRVQSSEKDLAGQPLELLVDAGMELDPHPACSVKSSIDTPSSPSISVNDMVV